MLKDDRGERAAPVGYSDADTAGTSQPWQQRGDSRRPSQSPSMPQAPEPSAAASSPDEAGADQSGRQPPKVADFTCFTRAAFVSAPKRCRGFRRKWLGERWHEVPSWLTSLLMHLAVLIVLSALAPPRTTSGRGTNMLVVTFSAAEQQPPARESVILLRDQIKQDGGEQGTLTRRAADQQKTQQQAPVDEQAGRRDFSKSKVKPIKLNLPPPFDKSPRSILPLIAPPRRDQRSPLESGAGQRRLDEIVDRFIQYDIGRLRGEVAAKARHDFSTLGPEAIPSLVRGLNKACYYSTSCPVVVISNKLNRELFRSDDRAMISYAVDNIGRGVSDRAPHANRILNLRDKWAKSLARDKTPPVDRFVADRAAAALASAHVLEKRGKRTHARRLYRELMAQYPGSVAAAEARRRLRGAPR